MRVALVSAPCTVGAYKIGENLGLKYLAASLEAAGHEVELFELGLDPISIDTFMDLLAAGSYPLVGFGVQFTSHLPETIRLAEKARHFCPAAHFTVGGQGTSFVWEEILTSCPAVDSAVCFEGEETLVELVDALETGTRAVEDVEGIFVQGAQDPVFTGYRQPPAELDLLPFPVRNRASFFTKLPYCYMLTSRGCSARCTFCCSGNFGNNYHLQPRWRARSPENIVAEIHDLVERYGVRHISFVDDDFLGACEEGPPRARNFLALLRSGAFAVTWTIECRVDEVEKDLFQEMKAVGLRRVLCGFDAGNDQDLKLFGKGATLRQAARAVEIFRALDIGIYPGFIMFHPLTDLDRIHKNIDFLESCELGGASTLINSLEIYKGSPLLAYFSRHCRLEKSGFSYRYRIQDPRSESYRMVLSRCLEPFRTLERHLRWQRLQLELEAQIDFATPESVPSRLASLAALQRSQVHYQLDLARRILQEVRKLPERPSAGDLSHLGDPFLADSRSRCLDLSDGLRRVTSIAYEIWREERPVESAGEEVWFEEAPHES